MKQFEKILDGAMNYGFAFGVQMRRAIRAFSKSIFYVCVLPFYMIFLFIKKMCEGLMEG
ncbi:MAG: hypothetical protein JW795_15515 [Chitinivibrionales bacterium]|nr:hypothetical protein [Chitinivibrionales bacterium]